MCARKSNDGGATWLGDTDFRMLSAPCRRNPTLTSLVIMRATTTTARRCSPSTVFMGGRARCHQWPVPAGRLHGQRAGRFRRDHQRSGLQQPHQHSADGLCHQSSDPVDPATVQATDFTVNGIAADRFVLSNGNATITFHFNSSPVITQGPQTMHIPANAFNSGFG